MHSISSKLVCRSASSLRRLWSMNAAVNVRVQTPLSCSACRQVRCLTSEYGASDMISRYTPSSPAVQKTRFQSTAQGSDRVNTVDKKLESNETLMHRLIRGLQVIAGPMVKRTVLVGSARIMYESCVEGFNFEEFFEACELPDTFQSWFIVLHLHVWMCLVRLKAEGKDGRYMYKKLVQMMWHDVEERMKNLGTIDTQVARDNLRVLLKQFYGLTIALDEGLLCDDTVLATALWRNLFYNKKHTDAEVLGRLVEYVRKNVHHLENYSSEHLLFQSGKIIWLPFKQDRGQQEIEKSNEHGATH